MTRARLFTFLDVGAAFLAIAVGIGHLGFAAAVYQGLRPDWLWFTAGGLAALYIGALNLARIQRPTPVMRWVCFGCNLSFLAFVAAAVLTPDLAGTPVIAAAIAAPLLTGLSLTPR